MQIEIAKISKITNEQFKHQTTQYKDENKCVYLILALNTRQATHRSL